MVTAATRWMLGRQIALGTVISLSVLAVPRAEAQGNTSPPTIMAVDKSAYCAYGDILTLNGFNFGLQGTRGYVVIGVSVSEQMAGASFQEFPVSIKEWSDTQIQARLFLPGGAAVGTWVATVHRDDGQLASQPFVTDYCPAQAEDRSDPAAHQPLPVINGLQMTRFHLGDRLIFSGENFGPQPSGGYVSLNGAFQDSAGALFYREFRVTVEGWSNFRIQAPLVLPTGAVPATWVATVHRGDGETASTGFTVVPLPPAPPPATTPPPMTENCLAAGDPVVEGFQKLQYCAGGDFLVIHGSNFCDLPESGWVSVTAPFHDAQGNLFYQESRVSAIGWLNTQIHVQFVAPPGAVPGAYTATVHVYRSDASGNTVVKTASGNFTVVSCPAAGG